MSEPDLSWSNFSDCSTRSSLEAEPEPEPKVAPETSAIVAINAGLRSMSDALDALNRRLQPSSAEIERRHAAERLTLRAHVRARLPQEQQHAEMVEMRNRIIKERQQLVAKYETDTCKLEAFGQRHLTSGRIVDTEPMEDKILDDFFEFEKWRALQRR